MKIDRLAAMAITVLLLPLYGCDEATVESAQEQLRPVKVMEFGRNETNRRRVFSGLSKSTREARLSFKVTGSISELPIRLGSQLRQGQLIAQLDPVTYDLEVQQSEANLLERKANLRNTTNNYTRMKELYANSSVSRGELDTARANEESAQAQMSAASKSLEIAKLNRSYTRLVADTDCQVASIDAEVNENVTAGTTVATVDCGGKIEVELTIPESLVQYFTVGATAQVEFAALAGTTFKGEVAEVGANSTGVGTTFPVTVELQETNDKVRPGMAADVTIVFAATQINDLSTIPSQSLVGDQQGSFVFVAVPGSRGDDATVSRRAVLIGDMTNDGVEIRSGLELGDLVIVAGASLIRDGQQVLLP